MIIVAAVAAFILNMGLIVIAQPRWTCVGEHRLLRWLVARATIPGVQEVHRLLRWPVALATIPGVQEFLGSVGSIDNSMIP